MSNSFGKLFTITSFGESHGRCVGVIRDGCPAGLSLTERDIQKEVDRRRPGPNIASTTRAEEDKVEIFSGTFNEFTTGAPICLLVWNRERVMRWISRQSFLGERLQHRLLGLLQSILDSLKILNHPARLAKVFSLMLLSWGIALLIQFILLRAFLPEARLVWAAFALSALSLGVSIPSSPGNIGIYEGSITLALLAFGIDQSVAFTYALVSHILSLLVTTLLGSYGLVREGYALRDIWLFSKQHREGKKL